MLESRIRADYACNRCHRTLGPEDYYVKRNYGWLDTDGHRHTRTCKDCCRRGYQASGEKSQVKARALAEIKREEDHRLDQWEFIDRHGLNVPVPGLVACDYEPDIRLPIEPFRNWLTLKQRRHEGQHGRDGFAHSIGLTERRLWSVLHDKRQRRVSLMVVDRALTHEGSAHLFELYPELYPDVDVPALTDVLADITPTKDAWLIPPAGPWASGHRYRRNAEVA